MSTLAVAFYGRRCSWGIDSGLNRNITTCLLFVWASPDFLIYSSSSFCVCPMMSLDIVILWSSDCLIFSLYIRFIAVLRSASDLLFNPSQIPSECVIIPSSNIAAVYAYIWSNYVQILPLLILFFCLLLKEESLICVWIVPVNVIILLTLQLYFWYLGLLLDRYTWPLFMIGLFLGLPHC